MPNYLDLFAGAGGLSEGFIRAGYEPVAHVEMDAAACYTLKTRAAFHWLEKQNALDIYTKYLRGEISREEFYGFIPEEVLSSVLNYEISDQTLPEIFEKIDAILDGKPLDLIVGGPPCQAYSIVGRSRSDTRMVGDKRNYLYKLYAEFLKRYQPKYFVFENVVGLLSARDEDGTLHLQNMRDRSFYPDDNTRFGNRDFLISVVDGVLELKRQRNKIGAHDIGDKVLTLSLYDGENAFCLSRIIMLAILGIDIFEKLPPV